MQHFSLQLNYITSLEESIDIENPIDTILGTQISISTGEKIATKQINLSFKDGPKKITALVIDNPCEKKQFPEEINRNYFCDGNKPNKDKVYEIDDKIVIGILHKPSICNNTKMSFVNNHPITGKQCLIRNSTPINELNSGMGDIFIRLAK